MPGFYHENKTNINNNVELCPSRFDERRNKIVDLITFFLFCI